MGMSELSTESANIKPKCTKEVVALFVGTNKDTLANDYLYKQMCSLYEDLPDAINRYTKVDNRKNSIQGTVNYIMWK